MSTPITNIPQGLLSLLGLRDFGAVPRFVPDTVQAGIDVTQFLLLNRTSVAGVTQFNAVSSDGPVETIVPPGELWYVHHCMAQSAVLAAGETIKLTVGISFGVGMTTGDPDNATAGARCVSHDDGFWLPAGGRILCRVMQITTVGLVDVTVAAIVTKLRI